MKLRRILRLVAIGIALSVLSVIIPVSPVHALAGTVYPSSGPVGSSVSVSCTGLAPPNNPPDTTNNIYIKFENLLVASGSYSSTTFNTTFPVPTLPRSSLYTVRVYTTRPSTGAIADPETALGTFQITPQVVLNTGSGYVGDQISLSGNGFNSSSTISIYFDNDVIGTTSITSNTDGSFASTSFAVPASARGSHTVRARDSTDYSPSVTFNVNHKMSVSPASGAVADKITVSGTGFAANSNISFYWDDILLSAGSVTSNATGSFTNTGFTIPATSRGSHTIKVTDESTNSATATFSVAQKMNMSPLTGFPGTAVTLTGSGFEANRVLTITYNNLPVVTNPASVTTDANGSFNASFTVPAGVAGTYTVQISDGTYSSSASFTAVVEAKISQTTTAQSPGTVGMQVTITGSGFKPSTTVTIYYSSTTVELAKTTTDAVGSFSVTVTIPASLGGDHTITATDGTTLKNFPFYMEKTAPPVPELLVPITTAKVKVPKVKNISLFDWKDVTDPSAPVIYTMEIAIDKDFAKVGLRKTGLTKSEYQLLEKEKLPSNKRNTPYYWRVKATDGASNESAWSAGQAFNVGFSFEFTGWVLYVAIGLGGIILLAIGFFVGRRSAMSY